MKGPSGCFGKDRKEPSRIARRMEDKAVVQDTRPRIPGAKKDTRRWCQGHVGTPHHWGAWEPMGGFLLRDYQIRRCTVCGKKTWATMVSGEQKRAESPPHAEVSPGQSLDSFL